MINAMRLQKQSARQRTGRSRYQRNREECDVKYRGEREREHGAESSVESVENTFYNLDSIFVGPRV